MFRYDGASRKEANTHLLGPPLAEKHGELEIESFGVKGLGSIEFEKLPSLLQMSSSVFFMSYFITSL